MPSSVGTHHKNPSSAKIRVSSVTPATSLHSRFNTAATIKGRVRMRSLRPN